MKSFFSKKAKGEISDAAEETESLQPTEPKERSLRFRDLTSPKTVANYVRDSLPLWFDSEKPQKGEKRFPISYFASMIAVAVCLFLVVSGNMMLTSAQTERAELENQIKKKTAAVAQTQTDLEADLDLVLIREIAVKEYGMVDEEYLRSAYVSTEKEDQVEVFEEKRTEFIGLFDWFKSLGFR